MASSSKFVLTAQLALQAPTAAEVKAVVSKINRQLKKIKAPQILDGAKTQAAANQASQGVDKTAKSVDKLNKNLSKTNNLTKTLQQRFKSRFIDATIFSVVNAGIVAVTSAFNASIRSAISFERELARVGQVTGKTNQQLSDLVDTISDISTSFGTSSSELLNVSRTLAQAGLSARDTEVALKAIAATDLAPTFENLSKTAEGAIAIFGQFGTGVEKLGDQLGSINALAGGFAVESGDLIEAIKRGGAAFQSAGGSLEEFLALFTTIRSTTREGAAQIATGLRTIFTRIQRPKTIQYFKELGVELTDATGKFIGAFEATRRLAQAFGSLEQGDTQLIAVAEQLGGTRQVTRVLPLLQQFAKSEDALQTALGGTNSILESRDRVLDTFSVKLQKITQSVSEFGRALLDEAKILNGILDATQAAIKGTTAAIQTLSSVLPEGTLATVAFGGALFALSKYFLGMSTAASGILALFTALIPVMSSITEYFTGASKSTKEFNENLAETAVLIGGAVTALKGLGGINALGNIAGGGLFNNPFAGATKAAKEQAGFIPEGGFKTLRESARFELGQEFSGANFRSLGEKSINFAGGAAVGAGTSAALTALAGRTSAALADYNKAVEEGDVDLQAVNASRLQTEKDLDKAGLLISGAAGGIASIFLGPVAGQIVGAATALGTEILFSFEPIKQFAADFRDTLAAFTGGMVYTTEQIAENARTLAIVNQQTKTIDESMKAFNDALKSGVSASNAFNEALGDDVANFLSLKGRVDEIRGRGVTRDTATDTERRVLDQYSALQQKIGKNLGTAFDSVAGDVIRGGGSFEDAFKRLDPQIRRYYQLFGTGPLEDAFNQLKETVAGQLQEDLRRALNERTKAELEVAEAVRNRVKIEEEARQIIADFGGADFTSGQREALILQRANAGAGVSGVSDLQDGSPEGLRNRAQEIGSALSEVRRQIGLEDEGSTARKALEKQEAELLRLSKQNYEITKDLIDVRKRELEVIEAKNKREQESLQSAIAGDFQKFFEGQAATGATAAIALGDQNLASAFGQSAIASAFSDLQSLQQSGVSSVFGQQIGGTGGLAERAAQFGLAGVGINSGADIAAGTTPEQEAIRAEIRGLAGVLPAAASAEQEAAAKQVEAADKQVEAARLNLDRAGVGVPPAVNRASGGAIFRRRGTDTVPAMLTPGEFVVRKSAVQRGNNLQLLRAMNNGGSASPQSSSGGAQYLSNGDLVRNSVSSDGMSTAAAQFTKAASDFSQAVTKLSQIKIHVQLDTTNINVNLTGTSALQSMSEQIKDDIMTFVGSEISNYKASEGGQLRKQPMRSDLPSFT